MRRLIGYARVSTPDQSLDLQFDDLKAAGCKMIFADKISGLRAERPGLDKCHNTLRAGDTLVVWRLDRLGRSMPHLVSVATELRERKVGFKSLKDGVIDTTTASGELIFNIFASLTQFDRELIRERTRAGLKAARARGKNGGRKPVSKDDPRVIAAKRMHGDLSISISKICETLKISKATLYRYIKM
jgi:DNA invertase Pin-like site-specific DNA recombinase